MKSCSWLRSVLFGFSLSSSVGLASEVPPLRWERLPTDGSESVQFLGLGPKGNVELYRVEPPGVFRIELDGSLRPLASTRGEPKPVFFAALDRQGEVWFFLLRPNLDLLLLDKDGRTKSLPPPDWAISEIGWMGDSPVVSTMPYPRTESATKSRIRPKGDPPLVMRFDGEKWRSLLNEPFKMPLPAEFDPIKVRYERQLLLAPASRGRLWLANEYRYRIRLLSPAGRVLLDADLGPEGLPRKRNPVETESARAKMRERAEREGFPKDVRVFVPEFSPVLSGLAEGLDGRLYLLTAPGAFGEGIALDRFDPATMELERLRTVGIEPPSRFSMVAAADGLYVAGFRESLGRFRLSWEVLEGAAWQLVKTLDGTVPPEVSPDNAP